MKKNGKVDIVIVNATADLKYLLKSHACAVVLLNYVQTVAV